MPTSLKSIFQGSTSSAAGGGHYMAPTEPSASTVAGSRLGYYSVQNIDISNGTVMLSLTGKFAIHKLRLNDVGTAGNNTTQIRMTADGVDIFDGFYQLPGTLDFSIWDPNSEDVLCPLLVDQSLEIFAYNTSATAAEVLAQIVALPE